MSNFACSLPAIRPLALGVVVSEFTNVALVLDASWVK